MKATKSSYKRKTVFRADRPVPELNKKYIDLVCQTFLDQKMWRYAIKSRRAIYYMNFDSIYDFTGWAITQILTDMLYWEKEIDPKRIVGFMRTSIIRNLDVLKRKNYCPKHREEDYIYFNSEVADIVLEETEYIESTEEKVFAEFYNYILDNYERFYSGKDLESHLKIAWRIINASNYKDKDATSYGHARTRSELLMAKEVKKNIQVLYNEYFDRK